MIQIHEFTIGIKTTCKILQCEHGQRVKFPGTIPHFGGHNCYFLFWCKIAYASFFHANTQLFFYPLFTAKQSEFDNLWMMIVAAKEAAVVAVAVVLVGTSSNSNTCTWHIFFSHLSSALFFPAKQTETLQN